MTQLRSQVEARLGRLDDYPRAGLAHLPTPLEEMPNLTAAVGGARLFVKRDDCTGLAFGGNKARQLEFYLGEARAQGADTVLITGAVQSNFVRMAAAGARKLGLDCHIQLEDRVPKTDPGYRASGNVLLDRLLGARIHAYPDGEDEAGADRNLGAIADGLRAEGRRPYIIPLAPGHAPLGALGYVLAAREILEQAAARGLDFDDVVVASGSGHTHAGLLFGFKALGASLRVTGVCVRRPAAAQRERLTARCREIADLLGVAPIVENSDVEVIDEFFAPGYGQLNKATLETVRLAAETEGLLLDPVYTGKAMAGALRRSREAGPGSSVLFVHTGGTPALFAYEPVLTEALGAPDL